MSEQNAVLRLVIRLFLLLLTLVPMLALIFFIAHFWHVFSCKHQPWVVKPIPQAQGFTWQHTGLITLWFDDAYQFSDRTNITNRMDQLGLTAAIAVPTGQVCERDHMGWADLVQRQDRGWEISSKLVNPLCDISLYHDESGILKQVTLAKQQLQDRGLRANHFVFPCGFSKSLVPYLYDKAKKNYSAIRQSETGINPLPITNPYNLKAITVNYQTPDSDIARWIATAKREKGWLIFVFHQIDDSTSPYHSGTQQFYRLLEMIKQSQLPVVIPSQALSITTESHKMRHTKHRH